uniref:Uncharacterized protein n=1 Tax=Siphoviridae sp. ctgEf12 TaxID=2825605 RepID=A0A8S5NUG4_9CAUD|nr:MAG TPA: hypothetical protein [Siphoviridae sp. ctgEf12]
MEFLLRKRYNIYIKPPIILVNTHRAFKLNHSH